MQPISQPVLTSAPATRPFAATLPGQATLAIAASLFIAAFAHLSIPLPWTPIPLTLSDFAVLLVGLTLSPATAFAALALYLVEAASGLPVLSPVGPGGLIQLLGVSAGFLFAYPLAAALTSSLSRRLRQSFRSAYTANVTAAAAGSALLMICGVLWFGVFLHLTPGVAFSKGALPFLPGQIVKVLAAAGIVTSARAALHRA